MWFYTIKKITLILGAFIFQILKLKKSRTRQWKSCPMKDDGKFFSLKKYNSLLTYDRGQLDKIKENNGISKTELDHKGLD